MSLKIIYFGIMNASTSDDTHSAIEYECILSEPRLCKELSIAAKSLDIDVYVFSAKDYNQKTGLLHGYRLIDKSWKRQQVPLPDIVYDRCFYRSAEDRRESATALTDMNARKNHKLLNSRLPSKFRVYEALCDDIVLHSHLPPTNRYQTFNQLLDAINRYSKGIILKPAAGMQGRGIVHISSERFKNQFLVSGRTRNNRHFSISFQNITFLEKWLDRFIGGSSFLFQPYLPLSDSTNRPFDIRVLLQKDADGKWKRTGSAARLGQKMCLTSNLHGGGHAEAAHSFLSNYFGTNLAERLLRNIHTISGHTAKCIEKNFGRFGELAFDLGIESNGNIWLIEVNAKPGRDSFRLINDKKAQQLSIERPLRYARYLTNRVSPTLITNHSFL
ncbi:YheC/YheD family protein [Paenibacillus sp. GSMTC-2017]|uniref:YheC/YheD family endospore coat-associated protein n=1 Tax=Paenibacillus sp. GSMTC-2017 TaxID=2794350 RepID=UPI0018D713AE|nr:YheC/YheD family protein [Paenibacillus sp. GSMTC-2017]MBH5317250.1 YheC/YheD family protein [Paenibacillus sp. GSMTC-2017]